MKIITPIQLKSWIAEGKEFFLLDVREEWEHESYNIGGINIPLGEVMKHKAEIPVDIPIVIYCEKGIRSAIAIQRLEPLNIQEIYNLEGGMKKWKAELETK